MNIEKLTQYLETVWLDERSSFDQKRNKTKHAIQQHLNQPNGNNTVLAVSGLTFDNIIETLTEALREINQYEYGQGERYENETYIKVHTVREALKAACASSGEARGVSAEVHDCTKYAKINCRCEGYCDYEERLVCRLPRQQPRGR